MFAADEDGSDSLEAGPVRSGRQRLGKQRARGQKSKRHSEDGDGFATEHPLGWGRRRQAEEAAAGKGVSSDRSERKCKSQAPGAEMPGSFAQEVQDAYAGFMAAAAQVPGAAPVPEPLTKDMRIVLNANAGPQGAIEILGKLEATCSSVDAPLPEVADFDGAFGVSASEGPDTSGRWTCEVTRRGDVYRLAVPVWCLLWRGCPVVAQSNGDGEQGIVAVDRPERDTGLWRVHIRKTLALMPANLHMPKLILTASHQGALHRGAAVEVRGLKSGAMYNGAAGTVLSSSPNQKGRWEVEVIYTVSAAARHLVGVGAPPGFRAAKTSNAQPAANLPASTSELKLGETVLVQGLQAAPHHNGRKGVVLGRPPQKSDRWRVQCDDDKGGHLLLDLKPENLCLLKENQKGAEDCNATKPGAAGGLEHAAPTVPDTSRGLNLGTKVVLHGMTGAPQYNGQKGVVLGRAPQGRDRWRVQCDIGEGGQLLLDVTSDNLQYLSHEGLPVDASGGCATEKARSTEGALLPEFRPVWQRDKCSKGSVANGRKFLRGSNKRRKTMQCTASEDGSESGFEVMSRSPPPAPPMPGHSVASALAPPAPPMPLLDPMEELERQCAGSESSAANRTNLAS